MVLDTDNQVTKINQQTEDRIEDVRKEIWVSFIGSQGEAETDTDEFTKSGASYRADTVHTAHFPLDLPHGATILEIIVYGGTGTDDLVYNLNAQIPVSNSNLDITPDTFVGTKTAVDVDRHLEVDNSINAYSIRVIDMQINDRILGGHVLLTFK